MLKLKNSTLESNHNIYNRYDYELSNDIMSNKLLATFTPETQINDLVKILTSTYNIMYGKIFVLFIKSTGEFVLTYNIEQGNINNIPKNTILVHRKKDFNVLFSVNGLNALVKSLNNGIEDENFPINWKNYQNSILLTQNGTFRQLNTKINQIIEI